VSAWGGGFQNSTRTILTKHPLFLQAFEPMIYYASNTTTAL